MIGYNYDDHSTAGGLYIRVGIGSELNNHDHLRYPKRLVVNLVFCLGTVIHSGLSILSNLEIFACARWTAVLDDFSRLLFSFVQFFFIFKHSNVDAGFLIMMARPSRVSFLVDHPGTRKLCSLGSHARRGDQSLRLVNPALYVLMNDGRGRVGFEWW